MYRIFIFIKNFFKYLNHKDIGILYFIVILFIILICGGLYYLWEIHHNDIMINEQKYEILNTFIDDEGEKVINENFTNNKTLAEEILEQEKRNQEVMEKANVDKIKEDLIKKETNLKGQQVAKKEHIKILKKLLK